MQKTRFSRIDQLRSWFNFADTPDSHSGHQSDRQSAGDAYRHITTDLREQSLDRHDKQLVELGDLQDDLRYQLYKRVAICAVLIAALGYVLFRHLPDNTEEPPQALAMWMEQQKLLQQVAQVQQWLGEGEAQSDKPPPKNLEELKAWLDQIQLSPDLQKLDTEESSGAPGFVPFQCPAAPVSCPATDIPSGPGVARLELSRLVRNANAMLVDDGKCEDTANLIGEYESLFGWRKSEAIIKALTELSVARCFIDENNTDNAQLHYQRAYCASVTDPDPHQAMSALYGMAKIAWLKKDNTQLQNYMRCSESLLDYHLRTETDVDTLNNYVTLSLMYYEFTGDTRESIRLEEKALTAVRKLASTAEDEDRENHLYLMMTLQMNLMEGYLTIGESEKIYQLHEEVKSNPMLEDGDRLVARGLLVMQDLIDGNPEAARDNLTSIINRYKSLPEFTTVWSWEAFDRWLEDSKANRTKDVDDIIRELRLVLSPERPTDSMQRLYKILSAIEAG